MPLDKATKTVEDLNKIAEQVAVFIPIVGNIVSSLIHAFHNHNATPPAVFSEEIAKFDMELDRIKSNDASWRVAHPEV